MTHRSLTPLLFLAGIGLGAGGAWGQSNPAPAQPDSTPAATAPAPAKAAPPAPTVTLQAPAPAQSSPAPSPAAETDGPQSVSPEVAAALAQLRPQYQPPKPPPAHPPPVPDSDKPLNHVVRLPRVLVTAKPPPIFSERALHDSQSLADIAMKRYVIDPNAMPGVFGPISRYLFQGYANQEYQADERLANVAALSSTDNMFSRAGDQAEADYLKSASEDTYLQRGDFGTTAPLQPDFDYGYPYVLRSPDGGSGP